MRRAQAGFTLIELIVSIVVIGIAVAGIVAVMNTTVSRSADPMIQEQAIAIAEAYLEEILVKEFADPGGGSETGRATWDNVGDYNGLADTGAHDQNGNAIAGLEGYNVSIAVAPELVSAQAMLRVTATVTHAASGFSVALIGYRGQY